MFKKDNVCITTNTFIQDSTFSEQLMIYHSVISIRNLTWNFTYILSWRRAKIWPIFTWFFFYQSKHKIKKYTSFHTKIPASNFQVAISWRMLYCKCVRKCNYLISSKIFLWTFPCKGLIFIIQLAFWIYVFILLCLSKVDNIDCSK